MSRVEIKYMEPVYRLEDEDWDLIAPEGYVYRNKHDGCVYGKYIRFNPNVTWLLGKKLEKPYAETEADYELIAEENEDHLQ